MTDARPPLEDDELVAADDAVIGKAFRVSLVVIVVIAAVIAGAVWFAGKDDETKAAEEATPVDAQTREKAREAPVTPFTDITKAAGIDFVHFNGAYGDKLLPETMGGGVAFLDYDGDGDQDLLFANGSPWPWRPQAGPVPPPRLYRNDGRGTFVDVTATAGLAVGFWGIGVAVADYDGDGDTDVLFTGVGGNRLFRNDGGRFEDVTATAGVAGDEDAWTTAAGFFDYDGDGDLDLFVTRYVKWSPEIDREVGYTLSGIGRAYGPPNNFEGAHPYLFRNDGDGTFTDVSKEAGIQIENKATGVPVGKGLALSFVDFDGDGDLDVFVANDTTRNFLFRNNGDKTFEEIGVEAGVAYDSRGSATGAMGADVGDFRGDGTHAVAVGNFASEMSSLYLARRDPWRFTDVSIAEGVGAPSRLALSFGVFFFDYDLDGWLDLFQTNGHLEKEINKVQPSQRYRQPSQLFWNAGAGARSAYAEVPAEKIGDLSKPVAGRAAAYADIDADGDLDVVITQVGEPPLLLRNDQALGRHWLRVKLVGKGMNRDAIGARLELVAGGRKQVRNVSPTRSYLSQVELPVTFGLGDVEKVESLKVIWPDGTEQEVAVEGVDRMITVTR